VISRQRICVVAAFLTVVVCGVVWSAGPARSQETGAAVGVMIRVLDPAGTGVPLALVQIEPQPVNAPEKMETNEKGELTLQLRPGIHKLTVTSPGFQTFRMEFDVRANGPAQVVPVVLQIAHVSGPVNVEAPSALTVIVNGKTNTIQAGELKGMPRKSVTVHNPHANADEKYEGVLLADLLTKYGAPLGKDLRGPALACYVVATGSDAYKAVYSLAEVDPSFHPGDVIVADTMDGKPLDAHSGPLRLVSTEDTRPARGVRNLVSIEVKRTGE
jgi:hypothetical protein